MVKQLFDISHGSELVKSTLTMSWKLSVRYHFFPNLHRTAIIESVTAVLGTI